MSEEAVRAGEEIVKAAEAAGKGGEAVEAVKNGVKTATELGEAAKSASSSAERASKGIEAGEKMQESVSKATSVSKAALATEEGVSRLKKINNFLGETFDKSLEFCNKNPKLCLGTATLGGYMLATGNPNPAAAAGELAGQTVRPFLRNVLGDSGYFVLKLVGFGLLLLFVLLMLWKFVKSTPTMSNMRKKII